MTLEAGQAVLLVDDDGLFRESTERALKSVGYRCLVASDVQQAWDLIETESPSVVISDIRIDGNDDLAFVRWAARSPAEPSIILVTGYPTVETAVEAVGQDPDGAMSAPTDPDEVAWYQLGPGMGVAGNVVFAGHVNWGGRLRVFGQIDQLDNGDVIQVIDAEGRGFQYAVESTKLVRAEGAPLEEIFAQPDSPIITLITCGGEYVASRHEYLDRVIVRAKGA